MSRSRRFRISAVRGGAAQFQLLRWCVSVGYTPVMPADGSQGDCVLNSLSGKFFAGYWTCKALRDRLADTVDTVLAHTGLFRYLDTVHDSRRCPRCTRCSCVVRRL
jgi:hypothetical protein